MHIPDGYLSPVTSAAAIAAMVPVWSVSMRKIKKTLNRRRVPMLALCSAFSFVIMMFNIPVIGGSSAHAVGATFIAILLGPWAACISVSTALFIQALVFGDGGILAFGANCLNMGFIMPFVGYGVYRLIAGKGSLSGKRQTIGAMLGSYMGLNAAAFFAALELGIQPLLFKTASGVPLYCPYPLTVAVPSMLFAHGLFAGPLEAAVTAAALALLAKFSPNLLGEGTQTALPEKSSFSRIKGLLTALAILVILTPLGLFAKGTAWGEWGAKELSGKIGYIPQGFAKLSDWWKAVLPDYTVGGNSTVVGTILSAFAGVVLILLVILIASRLMLRYGKADKD